MYVARLRPFAPHLGQVARSFAHAALDLRFNEGTVARGLSEGQANALRPLKQPGKGKAPLFDVCTEQEWDEMLAREAAAKLGLPAPVAARVLPMAPTAPVAPLSAAPPLAAPMSIPIEQLEHTDIGGQRVQHTAPPAAPTPKPVAAPGKASARPKKAGGGK